MTAKLQPGWRVRDFKGTEFDVLEVNSCRAVIQQVGKATRTTTEGKEINYQPKGISVSPHSELERV